MNNLALTQAAVLLKDRDPKGAIDLFNEAICHWRKDQGISLAAIISEQGDCEMRLGDLEGASDSFRLAAEEAERSGEGLAPYYGNRAYAALISKDLPAAEEWAKRALDISPGYDEGIVKLFNAWLHQGEYWKAYVGMQKLLLVADTPQNRQGIALMELLLSNMEYDGLLQLGVENFKSRIDIFRQTRDFLPVDNPWHGSASELVGKVVNVYLEQGLGDAIMFIPYLMALGKIAKEVNVHDINDHALGLKYYDLLGCFEGLSIKLHRRGANRAEGVDVWLFDLLRMGLPGKIVPSNCAQARPGTPNGKWGICWRGNPSHGNDYWRSMKWAEIKPFIEKNGSKLFCLQANLSTEEADFLGSSGVEIDPNIPDPEHLLDRIKDLSGVVAIDSFIGHLAGVLKIPTYLMLAVNVDWRWGYSGTRSDWYAAHELVRQRKAGEWRDCLDYVESKLCSTA